MKLKRADLREKKANSDHFYVGNKLVYDFIGCKHDKEKRLRHEIKNKFVCTFLPLVRHLEFGCRENCYEMRSNVLIDDVG